jgi:hypothetical protein
MYLTTRSFGLSTIKMTKLAGSASLKAQHNLFAFDEQGENLKTIYG